jgi:hypothetical protein
MPDPEREHGEDGPLLAGAKLNRPVVESHLDRPQKPQIHRSTTLLLIAVDMRVNRA